MASIAADFLHKFHTLQGTTLAERQKNFFKLLHKNAALKNNTIVLDSISTNLKPRTYQETLFRLDFFIYFRRTHELLQVLRTADDVFVSKIAKQVWFFKDTFNGVSPEELISEILPTMSFTVRMKILRKLSRYMECEKFEEVFDRVSARYGIFIASQFITGCGPAKIRNILREYPLKLTSTQLRILHEKDPELIEFYFSGNSVLISIHKTFFKFLFTKDRTLYDRLATEHKIHIRLGRRTTKKLVVEKKHDVIRSPNDFVDFINIPAMFRKLRKDSEQLFINSLPESVEPCINTTALFSGIPRRYQYSLFIKIFQKHYKIKLEDYPSLINEYLLLLIPNNSERAALAKARVNQGRDEYLKYLFPEEAIQLIKDKINVTSGIYERQTLIQYLVETCYYNDDIDALLGVMKYFCHRHKNEELNTHLGFINNIERLFGYKRFTDEMWNCLNELMTIYTLKFKKDETTYQKIQTLPLTSFNQGSSNEQKLRYLEYLFKKGESIDALIKEYLSTSHTFPNYHQFDKAFGNHFLLYSINKLARGSNDIDYIDFNVSLIREIDTWNAAYGSDTLSFYDFPSLLETFNHIIQNVPNYYFRYSNVHRHFRAKIFTTEDNIYRQEYLQLYWKHNQANLDDIRWFLKYDPTTVVTNFETIIKILTDKETNINLLRLWHFIKKYSHINIDTMAKQNCLEKLQDENCLEMKPKLVPCLSVLMEPVEYASLADSFKPENKKLDLCKEKEVRLYNLQIAIAAAFKNTRSYEVLPSLLCYCAGDYLKYALPSLYSLLYHTPENKLSKHLDFLSKKAVSVRKHALFMTCELSSLPAVEKTLQLLNKQEDVQSLQKHMFSTTIKYFVKNPLDSFFQLVIMNMQFIGKSDDDSLRSFVDHLKKIPGKYKAEFIEAVWNHMEKTVDIWEKLAPLKSLLLQSVEVEVARMMSLEFGIKIIQQHFLTEHSLSMSDFMFVFLAAKDEKEIIYTTIFTIVDQCQNETKIFDFLREWYVKVMSQNEELQYLQSFVDYFEKKATVVGHFYDYIKCFFLKVRLEHHSNCVSVSSVAAKILTFFEETTTKYGDFIIHLFAKEMDMNLRYFLSAEITRYDFYGEMIKQRSVAAVAMLLLHALSLPHGSADALALQEILEQIERIDNVGVQINLECKFKKFLTPKPVSNIEWK